MHPEADLPAAVLWDMDGTIVDSEPAWMAAETAVVEEAGGTWSHEQGLQLVGNDLMVSAQILLDQTPLTGTREDLVERLLTQVESSMRECMPWRPGARDLLMSLASAGVPSALVTMSWSVLATVLTEALPDGTFTTVVTGDQVEHGKPHPEPYLVAAARLGVDPASCVALEDSPTGVASALAAGVPTIAIPHLVEIEERPGLVLVESLAGVGAADLVQIVGR